MLQFAWHVSKGYRLCPWRSPYLRWRIETYTGIPAESVTAKIFFSFLWRERYSLLRYLAWVSQMRAHMSR